MLQNFVRVVCGNIGVTLTFYAIGMRFISPHNYTDCLSQSYHSTSLRVSIKNAQLLKGIRLKSFNFFQGKTFENKLHKCHHDLTC